MFGKPRFRRPKPVGKPHSKPVVSPSRNLVSDFFLQCIDQNIMIYKPETVVERFPEV